MRENIWKNIRKFILILFKQETFMAIMENKPDLGEEIISRLKEIISKLNRIIEIRNEKEFEDSSLDRNRP